MFVVVSWQVITFSFMIEFKEEKIITERCLESNIPKWYYIMTSSLHAIIMLICFILSYQVAVITLKSLRRTCGDGPIKSSERKQLIQVKITITVMFLFLFLWLPSLFIPIAREASSIADIYTKLAKCFSIVNSVINATVYSFSRYKYRVAYVYLLTHSPSKWRDVGRVVMKRRATIASRRLTLKNKESLLKGDAENKVEIITSQKESQTPSDVDLNLETQLDKTSSEEQPEIFVSLINSPAFKRISL